VQAALLNAQGLRFTPTGVGKSSSQARARPAWSVHPHGRGEKASAAGPVPRAIGSPPRAWGKAQARGYRERGHRFTPTGVGKSTGLPPEEVALRVHPHGRGEKAALMASMARSWGSPPRAWGKEPTLSQQCPHGRFTPTGVGKSRHALRARGRDAVHPHGRGEKCVPYASKRARIGSPPRAWGKVAAREPSSSPGRFTPTGVGKSAGAIYSSRLTTVHPHGRGEKSTYSARAIRRPGSPPRAWGKGPLARSYTTPSRFTPTGVGKRATHPSPRARQPVHPHGRGEKRALSADFA